MMMVNSRGDFNLDAFLNGSAVVSDSSKACKFVLKNLKNIQFADPAANRLWDIILNTPTADLSSSLDVLINKDPTLLKSKVCVKENRGFFITPLIAAIFVGNINHIKFLLEHTKNVNKADGEGYTATHYAAMLSTHEVLNLFKKMGADFEKTNLAGSSPSEFIRHRFYHLPGVKDFNIYLDHTGPAYNNHFYLLKAKNKSVYLPHLVYSPEALLAMRVFGKGGAENLNYNDRLGPYIYEQYKKKCETPEEIPVIYMQALDTKDDGSPVPDFLQGQYEVKARRNISLGEVLIEYTGYVISEDFKHETSFKKMDLKGSAWDRIVVDAEKGGNLSRYINDGPPNCIAIKIMHNGLPHNVLVALKDIKKDETLRLCYGKKNFFEEGAHVELAPKAFRDYLEETNGLRTISPILYSYSENTLISFTADEQRSVVKSEVMDPDKAIENLIKFRYHLGMIRYLITYEFHLKEYIEEGLINPAILRNVLYGLYKLEAIERLGLDEARYIALYDKVSLWEREVKLRT